MNRKTTTTIAATAALVALTGASGGCGSNGPAPSTTHTSIQGNPDAADKCKTVLEMHHPVNKQLTATFTVTCNFPIASADSSLVIQGKPIGSDNTNWDNVDDPQLSQQIPPLTLTFKHNCVTGIDYEATASIDALADDGNPVNASATTTPEFYGPSECSGN